jgi:site-specific recombinase XerD
MDVREFILFLREKRWNGKSLSSSTLNNRVRALRAFYSWLAREGYTSENLLAELKPPKVTETVIEPLTTEEIEIVFSTINQDTILGARNEAMLALWLDIGLCLSEIIMLGVEDVHFDRRYVKVLGKGDKERIVLIGASCHRTLLRYYHHFRVEAAHADVKAFFLTLDGYALDAAAVKSMVARLSRSSGVTKVHLHLFRHTYATQ